MQAQWRIDMLGGLRLTREDREITRFQTYKTGALLAYLALYLDQIHTREMLIGLMWPDSTLEQGRPSLSVALSSLRHQLEPPGIPSGTVIIAHRTEVHLNPTACVTDVQNFEAALQAARRTKSPGEQMQLLLDAIEGYRGELLPGYYEEWCLAERRRLVELYCQALRDLIRRLARVGDRTAALDYARRAVNADPLSEELHSDLIRLYVATGQPSIAVRQYHDLVQLLETELNMRPSAALQRFVQEIEQQLAKPVEAAGQIAPPPAAPTPARSAAARHEMMAGTITMVAAQMTSPTSAVESDDALVAAAKGLQPLFTQQGGWIVQANGAGFVVLFNRASDALNSALAAQRASAADAGSESRTDALLRIALHTAELGTAGQALRIAGDVRGPAFNHVERTLSAAHGGQTLCTGETAAILRRSIEPPLRIVDLGLYRLQAKESPEQLFEIRYPDRPQAEFPAPRAVAAPVAGLPLQFTRFFGRETELATLLSMLQEARLVTLTGPGGTGKTRLATETAFRLLERFADAVWFVPLEDRLTPDQVPDALLEALRQPNTPGKEPIDQVVEVLAGRPALLVLDNYEQLLGTAGTTEGQASLVIRSLLQRLPLLKCLITSRRRLDLSGEIEFSVPPLPVPEKNEERERVASWVKAEESKPEISAMLAYASVALFVDRAQAVKPDFQITPTNAAAVASLCSRLEGIPLAIELAAARSQVLTPAQMLSRLESRIEFLVSRRRDVATRHRTLRATIDWSYQLLSPVLQRFFACLSVFRDGWQLEAAEAICDEPLALDYLAQLQECSLIVSQEVAEGSDMMRFRMLESLQEYSRERLQESDDAEATRERHRKWFMNLALTTAPISKPAEQVAWLKLLEYDHENLIAALNSLLENQLVDDAAQMCVAISKSFWERCGRLQEARETMQRCMKHRNEISDLQIGARLLSAAGWLAYLQADYAQALEWQHQSLEAYQGLGDERGQSVTLNNLAVSAQDQGDLEQAREWFERSLNLARHLGEQHMIALRLSNLGHLDIGEGRHAAGQQRLEEAKLIFQALHDEEGIAACLCNLADLALRRQDWDEAQILSEQSLSLSQRLEDRRGIALARADLAEVAARQAKSEAAEGQIGEALIICRETGMHWLIPILLEIRARVCALRSTAEPGLTALAAAEHLRALLGAPRSEEEQKDFKALNAQFESQIDRRASRRIRADFSVLSLEETVSRALSNQLL